MTSLEASIPLYFFSHVSPYHDDARRFLDDLTPRDDVAISELVLVEFYTLLRNPAVLVKPLGAAAAVEVVQAYRRHPRWGLLGFDFDSLALHEDRWPLAADSRFGRRRIYDTRLALALRHQGVRAFATANVKDFAGFSFDRVWNPVAGPSG